MIIKKCTVTILIITILVAMMPVGAFALDPALAVASVDAGNLAAIAYANSAGFSLSSSVAEAGYSLSQAASQVFSSAANNPDLAAALNAVEGVYPEAAAAMAGSVGASSLAGAASAGTLSGAVGSGVTISAGSIILPVAVTAVLGAVIYYGLSNSVDIPDYGVSSYYHYADIVAAVPQSSSVTRVYSPSNPTFIQYYKIDSLNLNGASKVYLDHPASFNANYDLKATERLNATSSGASSYSLRWAYKNGNTFGGSLLDFYSPIVNGFSSRSSSLDSSNPFVFVYLDGHVRPAIYLDQINSDSNFNSWFVSTSENGLDQTYPGYPPREWTVKNSWRKPVSINAVPGLGSTPAEEMTIKPVTADGTAIITSSDPAIALDDLASASVVGELEIPDTENDEIVYSPSWIWDLIKKTWNPDTPLDNVGNPEVTNPDNDPSDPITLPTGGLLVPWHYVVRLINDVSAGASALFDSYIRLIPVSFANALYAGIVLALVFGLLKRFLE